MTRCEAPESHRLPFTTRVHSRHSSDAPRSKVCTIDPEGILLRSAVGRLRAACHQMLKPEVHRNKQPRPNPSQSQSVHPPPLKKQTCRSRMKLQVVIRRKTRCCSSSGFLKDLRLRACQIPGEGLLLCTMSSTCTTNQHRYLMLPGNRRKRSLKGRSAAGSYIPLGPACESVMCTSRNTCTTKATRPQESRPDHILQRPAHHGRLEPKRRTLQPNSRTRTRCKTRSAVGPSMTKAAGMLRLLTATWTRPFHVMHAGTRQQVEATKRHLTRLPAQQLEKHVALSGYTCLWQVCCPQQGWHIYTLKRADLTYSMYYSSREHHEHNVIQVA